nr:zinc finger protein 436-like [Rhipicephalus microplus]
MISCAASHEQDHSLMSVEGGLYSCRQCTYVTKKSGHMRRHLRKHTGERPFQCHLCPAAFLERSHLNDHIRTHTGERPFSCDHCSASFSQKATLVNHHRGSVRVCGDVTVPTASISHIFCLVESTHHAIIDHSVDKKGSSSPTPREPYHSFVDIQGGVHSCRQCAYVTSHKTAMKRHLWKHVAMNPFQCHLCPAVFTQKWNLTAHLRTHTGERPFSCDQCSASFSQNITLIRHMHIHTGKRPFSCDICDASFSRKDRLIRHMRTHTETAFLLLCLVQRIVFTEGATRGARVCSS